MAEAPKPYSQSAELNRLDTLAEFIAASVYTLTIENGTGDVVLVDGSLSLDDGDAASFGLVNIGQVLLIEVQGGAIATITITNINDTDIATPTSIKGNFYGDLEGLGNLVLPVGPRAGTLTITLAS